MLSTKKCIFYIFYVFYVFYFWDMFYIQTCIACGSIERYNKSNQTKVEIMQDSPPTRQILQNQLLLFYMNQNLTSRMLFRSIAITENKQINKQIQATSTAAVSSVVYRARSEILTTLLLKLQVFWDVTLSVGEQFPVFQRITVPSPSGSSR